MQPSLNYFEAAYHEAGHSIIFKALGAHVSSVSIGNDRRSYGMCEPFGDWRDDIEPSIAKAMSGYGGEVAVQEAMQHFRWRFSKEKQDILIEFMRRPLPLVSSKSLIPITSDIAQVNEAFLSQIKCSANDFPTVDELSAIEAQFCEEVRNALYSSYAIILKLSIRSLICSCKD